MTEDGDALGSYRWWLRLQVAFGLAGGAAWVVGAVMEEEFVTGAGLGLFVAALALRIGRRATPDDPSRRGDG